MPLAILIVHWAIRIFILALIVRAIISWVAPLTRHPAALMLMQVTDPILLPIRNAIGVHSGIDISPLIAIVILSVLDSLVLGLV